MQSEYLKLSSKAESSEFFTRNWTLEFTYFQVIFSYQKKIHGNEECNV